MSGASERESAIWVSVIDPMAPEGRDAITKWDMKESFEWSVPANAGEGDLVLGWVTGGTGFAYVFKVEGPPRKPTSDEFGPQQATLKVLERIQPPVPMTRLKADPTLRSWWLVRFSMQGVVRAQRESLAREHEWAAFLRLVESGAPKAAAALHTAQTTVKPSPGAALRPRRTRSLLTRYRSSMRAPPLLSA